MCWCSCLSPSRLPETELINLRKETLEVSFNLSNQIKKVNFVTKTNNEIDKIKSYIKEGNKLVSKTKFKKQDLPSFRKIEKLSEKKLIALNNSMKRVQIALNGKGFSISLSQNQNILENLIKIQSQLTKFKLFYQAHKAKIPPQKCSEIGQFLLKSAKTIEKGRIEGIFTVVALDLLSQIEISQINTFINNFHRNILTYTSSIRSITGIEFQIEYHELINEKLVPFRLPPPKFPTRPPGEPLLTLETFGIHIPEVERDQNSYYEVNIDPGFVPDLSLYPERAQLKPGMYDLIAKGLVTCKFNAQAQEERKEESKQENEENSCLIKDSDLTKIPSPVILTIVEDNENG